MYRANKNAEDINYVLDNLRPEDLYEVIVAYGEENWKEKALKNIIENDTILGKSKKDNTPVLVGGICHCKGDEDGVGVVWLLSTNEIKKHIHCFFKEFEVELKKADEKYWVTYNFIHEKNRLAKRWLKKFNYKFDNPKPEGIVIPEGFEFFYRLREVKGLGE